MQLEPTLTPEDCMLANEQAAIINAALLNLSERQERILRRRYGFFSEDTLAEIGKELGISGTRINQIETIALRRLRKKLRSYCGAPREPQQEIPRRVISRGTFVLPAQAPAPPPRLTFAMRILQKFPHCNYHTVRLVGEEFAEGGYLHAQEHKFSDEMWLWGRSRYIAGINESDEQAIYSFNQWKELNDLPSQPA